MIRTWNMSSWMKSRHRKLLLALFPCTNQHDPVFQVSSKLRNPQSNHELMFLNYHLEGDIWFRNMNYINSWTFGLVSCFLIKNCLLNDNSETWAHDLWFSWFLMNLIHLSETLRLYMLVVFTRYSLNSRPGYLRDVQF